MGNKKTFIFLVALMLICFSSFYACVEKENPLIAELETSVSQLPAKEALAYEDKGKIGAALSTYNSLSETDKGKVKAELVANLNELNQIIAEWDLKITSVSGLINALPDVTDNMEIDEADLIEAKEKFDALSEDLKNQVSEELKTKLNAIIEKLNDNVILKFADAVKTVGESAGDVFLIAGVKEDIAEALAQYEALSADNRQNAVVITKKALLDEMNAEYLRLEACSKIDDLVITSADNIFTDESITLSAEFTNPQGEYACEFAVNENTIGAEINAGIFTSVLPGKITLTATVDFGKSIKLIRTKEITVKGVKISGEIALKYPVENSASIAVMAGGKTIRGEVTNVDGKFSYLVDAPRNTEIRLIAECLNYNSGAKDISVEAADISAQNFALNDLSVTSLVNTGAWSYKDGVYTVSQSAGDCYHYAGFDGQVKDTWKLDATISNCNSAVMNGTKLVYTYGLLITGTPANKTAIVFQSNDEGENWRICAFNISSWGNKSFIADSSITPELAAKLKGVYYGGSLNVSLIRVKSEVYLFIDNEFIGFSVIGAGDNGFKADNGSYPSLPNDPHPFGFFTRAGNGASYSNVNIEYDAEKINSMLYKTVAVNKNFGVDDEFGSIEITGTADNKVKLGDEIIINITPKPSTETQINTITEFSLNGVDRINDLVGKEGVYTITLKIYKDLQINVTINAAFAGLVTGKVSIQGDFGSLADLEKVMVGIDEAALNKETGDFSIYLPVTDNSFVVTACHKYMNNTSVVLDNLTTDGATVNLQLSGMGYQDLGNTNNWTRNENNEFTVAQNTGDMQQFISLKGGSTSDIWLLETTVSDVISTQVNDIDTYCYGILISGDAGQKASLVFQRSGTAPWEIKALNFSAWTNTNFVDSAVFAQFQTDLSAPCQEGSVKISVIRYIGNIFLFINDKYVGTATLQNSPYWKNTTAKDGHDFGLYTRASNGATFKNNSYTFDSQVIKEKMNSVAIYIDQDKDGVNDMGILNIFTHNGSISNFAATVIGDKNGYVANDTKNYVGKIAGSEALSSTDFVFTVTLNYNTAKSEKHGLAVGFADKEINFTLENKPDKTQPRTYVVAFTWNNLGNKYVLGSPTQMASSTNAVCLAGDTAFLSDINEKGVVMRLIKNGNTIYQLMKLSGSESWGIIGKLDFLPGDWGSGKMYLGLSNLEGNGCIYTDISYSYDETVITTALTDIPAEK